MEPGKRPIPNRLRMHRNLMRYKQHQVAKLLGLRNTVSLSRWENGVKLPNALNLMQLSILYRTYPNELYCEYMQELRDAIKVKELDMFNK